MEPTNKTGAYGGRYGPKKAEPLPGRLEPGEVVGGWGRGGELDFFSSERREDVEGGWSCCFSNAGSYRLQKAKACKNEANV